MDIDELEGVRSDGGGIVESLAALKMLGTDGRGSDYLGINMVLLVMLVLI